MKFWDASAIVPLLVSQVRSRDMLDVLRADPEMVVWWATPVECLSAVARLGRENLLTAADITAAETRLTELRNAWEEVAPTDSCRRLAARMLRVHVLRSADAFQAAAAMVASDHNPENLPVVSLDDRLSSACRKEGFVVVG